jgi:hypothetical protein
MPTAYDPQSNYNKHQGGCGCDDPKNCDCPKDDCSCCPPGLVAVFSDCNEHAGCLTPHDAEEYNNSQVKCGEGFVKLIDPVTGAFIGCVTPEEYSTIIAQLSPIIDPVPSPVSGQFNVRNAAINIANNELFAFTTDVTVNVDRLGFDGGIVIQFGTIAPLAAGITLLGGPQLLMQGAESSLAITIDVDNTVSADTYNFNIELIGGGLTKVIPVEIILS